MHKITQSVKEWMSFLDSAAWLYKYPWQEQVMIYAQRPDAKACASIEIWNNTFSRWVNKGARGIAIIDHSSAKPALRYVFDVSDTNTQHNVPFHLWEVHEKHKEQILEELQHRFGEISENEGLTFSDRLYGIIHNAVSDNSADYVSSLMNSLDGSALDEYDDFNIKVWFEQMTELSVAYCVLTRLGYDARTYIEASDFISVMDFNTPDTIAQLCAASADISEMVLRQIERSVRSMEKHERVPANTANISQNKDRENERSANYGNYIQQERRLPDSRPGTGYAADREHRQVREDAQIVPDGASERNLWQPDSSKQADGTPLGDRSDSESTSRADGIADGESQWRDGGTESARSDEVGGAYEHVESPSRRNNTGRADLQLSLFPTEQEQIESIVEAESIKPFAFSLPVVRDDAAYEQLLFSESVSQKVIDDALCLGGNEPYSLDRI
jgi:regulator of sigma D